MRFFYTLLFYAATPAILARLAWRGRREPAYRQGWAERFGWYGGAKAKTGVIWFHAVSVGEAEAAFPLLRVLLRRFPEIPFLVTSGTPTGFARVRAVLGGQVEQAYLPYDLPGAVGRFLDHYRPRLAAVMETEIWPNLYHACAGRSIPLALVNARLSERSAKGYARLPGLTRATLACIELIAAQTSADAERFLAIGAREASVRVTGNIKYDLELPADYFAQAAALRQALFGARPVWIAASTHEGEEPEVLKAFARIRQTHPGLLLVLVPRHVQRFDKVERLCHEQALDVVRRSSGQACADAPVFLVDSVGELRLFFAAADLAFVGGSLVPVGGHNVLEPALAGVPVLFGPHMFNFHEVGRRLVEAGGAARVEDAEALAAQADALLQDPQRRRRMGEDGRHFVEAGRGALARVEAALAALLEAAAAAD